MDPLLLQALMSTDNSARKQAEDSYNTMLKSDPAQVAGQLLTTVTASEDQVLRSFSAILLRRVVDGNGEHWQRINNKVKGQIQQALFSAFQQEQTPFMCRKLAHAVAACASAGGWAGLVEGAAALAAPAAAPPQEGGRPAGARAAALFLLEQLAELAPRAARGHAPALLQAYGGALADPSPEVPVAALRAAVALLLALGSDRERAAFAPLLAPMLGALQGALRAGEEPAGQEVLGSLADLAREAPLFFGPGLAETAQALLAVANHEDFEVATRGLALEALCTLAEGAPAPARRCAALARGAFPAALALAAAAEEEAGEWARGPYDDAVDCEEAAAAGADALERLAAALGAKVALPAAMAQVPALAASAGWRERRAAAVFLARLADGAPRGLRPFLPQLVPPVAALAGDPHPRVAFQGLQALGRLAEVYGGHFQRDHADAVLPLLARQLAAPANCPRVRGHAASALVNFCLPEHCEADSLAPHTDATLSALAAALAAGPAAVQEAALTALACVAQVAEADFAPYYPSFMPGIKGLLAAPPAPETEALRGKAMEAAGLIGAAVGPAVFRADAAELLAALAGASAAAATGGGGGGAASPLEHLGPAAARVVKALGRAEGPAAAAPHLPALLLPVFRALDAEIKFELADAGDEDGPVGGATLGQGGEDGLDTVTLNIKGFGNKRVTMNTHAVFEKAAACRILHEYAGALEEHFLEYAQPAAQRLFPLVTFQYSEEVRGAAALALGVTFGCLARALERGAVGPEGSPRHAEVRAAAELYLENCVQALVATALREEPRGEARACLADAMREVLQFCYESGGGLRETGRAAPPRVQLPLEKARACSMLLVLRARESLKRREEEEQAFREAQAAGGFDEEDAAVLEEALGAEEELMGYLVDCLQLLMKGHGEAYLPVFQAVVAPAFVPVLAGAATVYRDSQEVVLNAVCVFVDAVEWCGPGARPYAQECLPFFVACMAQEHAGLAQAAVYGVTQVAKRHPDLLQPEMAAVLSMLAALLEDEHAQDEERVLVTENAVSLLGVVATTPELAGPGAAQLFAQWLGALPLTHDAQEARDAHRRLAELAAQNHPLLAAAGDLRHVPAVLRVAAEVAARAAEGGAGGDDDEPLADGETGQRLLAAAAGLRQSAPAAFEGAWAGLTERQRGGLQAALVAGGCC